MWDIEDLSIKTHILLDWNYTPEHIEISDDEELLLVCAKNEEYKESRFYTFFTETGINMSFTNTNLVIDRFHLIASNKGERLLFIDYSGNQYNLSDPYNLEYRNATDAYDLFEKKQIQEPYIIQSDKIIYTAEGNVKIEELLPDDWVNYLRLELRDTKNITISPTKTIDTITEIIENKLTNDYNDDGKEFEGKFLKWGFELNEKSVRLTVIDFNIRKKKWNPDHKKKHLDILPKVYPNEKNFILNCEILENDDFVTITRIGVILWTYKSSVIKKHYFI
ncbi:hypothetical protein F8M41_009205 [Gigaspora margarita]|uniref:Uncharacterized protein n=1 Tax=Gigaspora margarita TaxID=4874 RepID=A0A8H4EQI1_GIGMA|nr:hypothetical protein F8M41_009205 [Gigaspora margarita]